MTSNLYGNLPAIEKAFLNHLLTARKLLYQALKAEASKAS
jgi:hypothetical protein